MGSNCQLENSSEPVKKKKTQLAILSAFSSLLLFHGDKFFVFHVELQELGLELMTSFLGIKLLKPFRGTVRELGKNEGKQAVILPVTAREPSITQFKTLCSGDAVCHQMPRRI